MQTIPPQTVGLMKECLMGLFSRKPKLPSYVDAGLDALLQDPLWAQALSQAGIVPEQCELIIRLADPTVGPGFGGLPEEATPALLIGQGKRMAMAYPGEREIKVVTRDVARADLQTTRAGEFQLMFGPVDNLDAFAFWGRTDNLRLGTPEGEAFGPIMVAFMSGKLQPGQVRGTPQSLA